MRTQQLNLESRSYIKYIWLLLGAGLTYLYSGNLAVPLAAWLGPVFVLRFIRSQKPLKGLAVALLALTIVAVIQNKEIIPIPGPAYYIIVMILSLIGLLPYVVDRLLSPRLSGFSGTLVLPTAWVAVDYLFSFGGWGTWGAIAYTQVDNLPLLQLASATGIWGITFVIIWFVSVINWIWEKQAEWSRIRYGSLIYFLILSLILLSGGIRLRVFVNDAESVRVASLSVPNLDIMKTAYLAKHSEPIDIPEDIAQSDPRVIELALAFQNFTLDPYDLMYKDVLVAISKLHENLFTITRQEARSGAKIITWSEGNGLMLKSDEQDFLEQAQQLAREEDVFLAIPMFVVSQDSNPDENKIVTIDADGQILTEYHKTKLLPGETSRPGDGSIPIVETPFGHLGGMICYDMDFPGYPQKVGSQGADIVLVPSGDWKGISPIHTEMAIFRAVENGFSMVRQASHGLSKVVDYQGRILAAMDYFKTNEKVMVAQVPTRGSPTIYSRIGDFVAWLCLAGIIFLLIWALVSKKPGERT